MSAPAPAKTADNEPFELVAEFEPDEDAEVRIIMMILGYPESEIERVVANTRLEALGEM